MDKAETSSAVPEPMAPAASNAVMLEIQLAASAEVFWLPRRASRVGRGIAYRRFETLAEAVRYSVESIANAADIRIYTDAGPISQGDIDSLYRAASASA